MDTNWIQYILVLATVFHSIRKLHIFFLCCLKKEVVWHFIKTREDRRFTLNGSAFVDVWFTLFLATIYVVLRGFFWLYPQFRINYVFITFDSWIVYQANNESENEKKRTCCSSAIVCWREWWRNEMLNWWLNLVWGFISLSCIRQYVQHSIVIITNILKWLKIVYLWQ